MKANESWWIIVKNKKVVTYIIVFLCTFIIFTNFSYALDPGAFSSIYQNDGKQQSIFDIGGSLLGVVQAVGYAVALIMLVVLGIKYMYSSPDEKATIKDKAIIYVIGAVVIFGSSSLVGIIGRWANATIK